VVVQLAHGAAQLAQGAHGTHELHVPQLAQPPHVPQAPQGLHGSTTQGWATTTVCGRERQHHESRQHWQPVAPISSAPKIVNANNFFMVGLLPVSG
jgi:hypothetical protein